MRIKANRGRNTSPIQSVIPANRTLKTNDIRGIVEMIADKRRVTTVRNYRPSMMRNLQLKWQEDLRRNQRTPNNSEPPKTLFLSLTAENTTELKNWPTSFCRLDQYHSTDRQLFVCYWWRRNIVTVIVDDYFSQTTLNRTISCWKKTKTKIIKTFTQNDDSFHH